MRRERDERAEDAAARPRPVERRHERAPVAVLDGDGQHVAPGVDRAEATLLSTIPVVLVRSGEETWRILPRASFADHMVRWLVDGMTELGSACPEEESAQRSVRPAQHA